MSIALFASPGVLAPLQGWWRRFMPATAPGSSTHSSQDLRARGAAIHPLAGPSRFTGIELQNTSRASAPKPLRIVRILEAGQAPTHVGRMLISGRMADVCAELDRLAAREAALH